MLFLHHQCLLLPLRTGVWSNQVHWIFKSLFCGRLSPFVVLSNPTPLVECIFSELLVSLIILYFHFHTCEYWLDCPYTSPVPYWTSIYTLLALFYPTIPPGFWLFCCYQPSCVVNQQSWFGLFCFIHFPISPPPPPPCALWPVPIPPCALWPVPIPPCGLWRSRIQCPEHELGHWCRRGMCAIAQQVTWG